MEILDIHGIVDGREQVIIHGVSRRILSTDRKYLSLTQALCYIGRTDNPSFSETFRYISPILLLNRFSVVGPEPLALLADCIWRSVGPSGPNKVTGLPIFYIR